MYHNFHIVSPSVYPFVLSVSLLNVVSSLLVFMKFGYIGGFSVALFFFVYVILLWLKDVVGEGLSGYHGPFVVAGFKYGFLFFIFTEVMFFFSIFWFFYNAFWFESIYWSPSSFYWLRSPEVPLCGTFILLSSSVTATWLHNNLINSKSVLLGFGLTLFLGILFLGVQIYEYSVLSFNINSAVWGSMFFFGTGFHGFHVFLGVIILGLSSLRMNMGHFNKESHFMVEGGLVYWHFVDVVWLFLYLTIYNWPIYFGV